MLDKPDQVGYDRRQALHDRCTSGSAGLFAWDATAPKLTVTTCSCTLLRTIPLRTYYRGQAKPTGAGWDGEGTDMTCTFEGHHAQE